METRFSINKHYIGKAVCFFDLILYWVKAFSQ